MLRNLAYAVVGTAIVALSFTVTSYFLNRYSPEADFSDDAPTATVRAAPLAQAMGGHNLLLASEDFANARWTRYQIGAIQSAAAPAPNGTNAATRLAASTDKGRHFIYSNVGGMQPGAPHAFSVYFKPENGTSVGFEFRDNPQGKYGNVQCNAPKSGTDGSITKAGDIMDGAVDNAGNGWFRCWVAMPFNLANAIVVIQLRDPRGSTDYQGDGRMGVLIWGAQFEQGNRPTAYMASTGAVAKAN
jgi:hypothetical protein